MRVLATQAVVGRVLGSVSPRQVATSRAFAGKFDRFAKPLEVAFRPAIPLSVA